MGSRTLSAFRNGNERSEKLMEEKTALADWAALCSAIKEAHNSDQEVHSRRKRNKQSPQPEADRIYGNQFDPAIL